MLHDYDSYILIKVSQKYLSRSPPYFGDVICEGTLLFPFNAFCREHFWDHVKQQKQEKIVNIIYMIMEMITIMIIIFIQSLKL